MSLNEVKSLVHEVAQATPTDHRTQTSILERVNGLRNLMRQGGQKDLVAYLEIASILVESLASGRPLTPDRISGMVSKLVKQVEATFFNRDAVDEPLDLSEDEEEENADEHHEGVDLRLMHDQCLGEILVQLNILTPEQVEEGLRAQRATGVRIGEALVMLNYASWEQVNNAVRLQNRMRETIERAPALRLDD